MIQIANAAQDSMINEENIANQIGLCYYDPIDESVKEVSSLASHFMSVNPYEKILRKYYLVAKDTLSVAMIRLTDNSVGPAKYSAKVIISELKPSIALFDDITPFNLFKIANPQLNHLIPVWVLLESFEPITEITTMGIELEYENMSIWVPN